MLFANPGRHPKQRGRLPAFLPQLGWNCSVKGRGSLTSAGKGYDFDEVREIVNEFGFTAHIRARDEEA